MNGWKMDIKCILNNISWLIDFALGPYVWGEPRLAQIGGPCTSPLQHEPIKQLLVWILLPNTPMFTLDFFGSQFNLNLTPFGRKGNVFPCEMEFLKQILESYCKNMYLRSFFISLDFEWIWTNLSWQKWPTP